MWHDKNASWFFCTGQSPNTWYRSPPPLATPIKLRLAPTCSGGLSFGPTIFHKPGLVWLLRTSALKAFNGGGGHPPPRGTTSAQVTKMSDAADKSIWSSVVIFIYASIYIRQRISIMLTCVYLLTYTGLTLNALYSVARDSATSNSF